MGAVEVFVCVCAGGGVLGVEGVVVWVGGRCGMTCVDECGTWEVGRAWERKRAWTSVMSGRNEQLLAQRLLVHEDTRNTRTKVVSDH